MEQQVMARPMKSGPLTMTIQIERATEPVTYTAQELCDKLLAQLGKAEALRYLQRSEDMHWRRMAAYLTSGRETLSLSGAMVDGLQSHALLLEVRRLVESADQV